MLLAFNLFPHDENDRSAILTYLLRICMEIALDERTSAEICVKEAEVNCDIHLSPNGIL